LSDVANELFWFAVLAPIQLVLGGGLFRAAASWTRRRRSAVRAVRAYRTLAVAAGWCAAAAVAVLVVAVAAGVPLTPGSVLQRPAAEIAFAAGTTATLCGVCLSLRAGRLEARGRLRRSRSLVSAGARLWFLGAIAECAILVGATLLGNRPAAGAVGTAGDIVAIGAIAASGGAGLLAGLTGKPRPTVPLAAALYGAGRLALVLGPALFFR
jgi:hypothetical protein